MLISTPQLLTFFFFNDTATTEIYTLSLHDALPISFFHITDVTDAKQVSALVAEADAALGSINILVKKRDRKSTRLISSHGYISYAVFCLKKKNRHNQRHASALP